MSTVPDWHQLATAVLAASLATMTIFAALTNSRPQCVAASSSLRTTLLTRVSAAQRPGLPYAPDVLPSSHDIDRPYGSMRIYEFGPKAGRKVLSIQGQATPSQYSHPLPMILCKKDAVS